MVATIKYKTLKEIEAKLDQFGLSLSEALRVVQAVVTAHNDAVGFDPNTAAGQFRYIYGTRTMREIFCAKGWEVDREQGIESVYDPNEGVKIVYQSVDQACNEHRPPKAVSEKGAASRNLVERSSTAYLFPEMEEEDRAKEDEIAKRASATTWYFCVSIDGDDVRAELSLPYRIEDNNFAGFIERIFLIDGGEWAGSGIVDLDDDEPALEFEPIISKK